MFFILCFLRLIFRLQIVFTTGAFLENMENVVFIIKILAPGMNVLKSHSRNIESKKYYEILSKYECVEYNDDYKL